MAERRKGEGCGEVGGGVGGAFGPGAHGDAVLIRARAKVSRGWQRVALATLVVPHPSGLAVGPKTTPERQPPLALSSLSFFLHLSHHLLPPPSLYHRARDLYMPNDARVCASVFPGTSAFLPGSSRAFPFGNNRDSSHRAARRRGQKRRSRDRSILAKCERC